MKKSSLLIIFGFLMFNHSFGQDQQKYSDLVQEAWNLYEEKNFRESGKKYSEAFVALGNKGAVSDRYNAACSWALAKEIDYSFVQLFTIAENGNYINYDHMASDHDVDGLHVHKR